MASAHPKFATILLWLQGVYFTLTGIWPFVHLKSFIWVTGPKTDIWLLKTVAILIVVIGLALMVAARTKSNGSAIYLLAIGGAAGLMGIDIYYATNDVIWDVYLLDAVAELIIILAWAYVLLKPRKNVL